ncbi:MAG: hypothetical protein IJC71_07620 [Clostridia bacterium]|nr:hypothetical protein [Clostridia bacterium]
MQHRNLTILLSCLLAAVCIFLAVNLFTLLYNTSHLPEETIENIVSILADSNIRIAPDIISARREHGTVYVCNSGDYNRTVAQLLGKSTVTSAYIIPDGEILFLSNGARCTFGENFSFHYNVNGDSAEDVFAPSPSASFTQISEEKKKEITGIVVDFLDSGSREFESGGNMNIVTGVENIWENGGAYYALCSRTIDGIAVTENYALCTVTGGKVTEAFGSWSFLTLGESYTAQLSDIFNILFHVRKEIPAEALAAGVAIESINLCYSLYFYGEEEDFCLIPCWQIVTDSAGEYIYNAIDSTLYTKSQS